MVWSSERKKLVSIANHSRHLACMQKDNATLSTNNQDLQKY